MEVKPFRMSPPKKLQLPHSPAPLPPSQDRRVLATGLSSMLVAGLMVGSAAIALLLIPIVSNLAEALSPVQVVSTPSLEPSQKRKTEPSQQRHLVPLPSPPSHQASERVSTHEPKLEKLPSQTVLTSQALTSQSTSSLELLESLEEQEEARFQELVQQESLARAEELRQQAEKARRDKELAEIRKREAAENAKEQQRIAALNAERNRLQASLAKEAAASKQRQTLANTVATAPSVVSKKLPSYPTSARRAGSEGTTRITATISTKGKVSSAYVSQSSGHQSLDKTALAAVKRWRFAPARNGLGEAIPHQVILPIPFRLN